MFTLNNETMEIVYNNLKQFDYKFGAGLYKEICKQVVNQDIVEMYMYQELDIVEIGLNYLDALLKGSETFNIELILRDEDEDGACECYIEVVMPTKCLTFKNFDFNKYTFTLNLEEAEYCGDLTATLHYSETDIYFEEV